MKDHRQRPDLGYWLRLHDRIYYWRIFRAGLVKETHQGEDPPLVFVPALYGLMVNRHGWPYVLQNCLRARTIDESWKTPT
jgi:hypothetical protein